MDRVRFVKFVRLNWLWAFSFVVVLLPLTLGGCGAALTPPCSYLTQLEFDGVVAGMRDLYTDVNECILWTSGACIQDNNAICRDCANYACPIAFP